MFLFRRGKRKKRKDSTFSPPKGESRFSKKLRGKKKKKKTYLLHAI